MIMMMMMFFTNL